MPVMPWVEAMLTIAPGRLSSMQARPNSCDRKNAPLRLVSITSSHSAR